MSYMVKYQGKHGMMEIYFECLTDAEEWIKSQGGEIWLRMSKTVMATPDES